MDQETVGKRQPRMNVMDKLNLLGENVLNTCGPASCGKNDCEEKRGRKEKDVFKNDQVEEEEETETEKEQQQ